MNTKNDQPHNPAGRERYDLAHPRASNQIEQLGLLHAHRDLLRLLARRIAAAWAGRHGSGQRTQSKEKLRNEGLG